MAHYKVHFKSGVEIDVCAETYKTLNGRLYFYNLCPMVTEGDIRTYPTVARFFDDDVLFFINEDLNKRAEIINPKSSSD